MKKKMCLRITVIALLGVVLTGCAEMEAYMEANGSGNRLPRYTYEELYAQENWSEGYGVEGFDGWDFGENAADGAQEIWDGDYYEGSLGDVMENVFFSYRVDAAMFVESYAGYEAAEGNELIDVTVSVKNTFGEEIPMFNTDFQIQWGTEGEDDYRFGLSELALADGQVMPEEFTLQAEEAVQYHMIFEVPAGYELFSLSYLEIYYDGTQGDVYFVYFEPERRDI